MPQASLPLTEAAVAPNAGLILMARTAGEVTLKYDGETGRAAGSDQRVPNRATIVTGANSHAVLVFSNGNTLQLGAETTLTIADFTQEPFAQAVKVAELVEEPSVSQTRLQLVRGSVISHVKRLKVDLGSSFRVETPVGQMKPATAGGIFYLEFRPVQTGQASFELRASAGECVFFSKEDPAKTIRVPEGQKISLTVNVTRAADGQLRATAR